MQFLRFSSLVLVPAVLCACSDTGNAQSGAAAADQAEVAAADSAPAPAHAAEPEDVTAAGFPFLPGRYITGDDCEATELNFGLVDFTHESSHEFEADGNALFARIVKLAEGHYRITEQWPDFETDGVYTVDADYIAEGEGRFRRVATEGDETYTEHYLYCAPNTAMGSFGQY